MNNTNDLSNEWKVDTANLLKLLVEENPKGSVLKQPVRLFQSLLIQLAERAIQINDKELNEFFSEITHIYKAGARITILECDSKIAANYEYNGMWTGKIHGRGGTDFQPAIDYYRKHIRDYAALVYFTDGECRIPLNVPRDTIWVITSAGNHNQKYPGKTLFIPKTSTH